MRIMTALLLGFGFEVLGLATTPAPYAGHCALLDRVIAATGSQSGTSSTALDVLESVALGRASAIGSESLARFGIKPDELHDKGFEAPTVRACALRKIGETGLPRAGEFLRSLKQEDIGTDSGQQIWPAAQIALRDVRLRGIADPQSKINYLESMLIDSGGAVLTGAVANWAVNQLCDRGALASLSIVQKSIRKSWSGQYGEDEVAFCEARIQVLRRNPDRIRALGSVLVLDNGVEDTRVKLWAIYQLDAMHSPQADAELDRFASEIGKVPEQSAKRQRLSLPEGVIRDIQSGRRARAK